MWLVLSVVIAVLVVVALVVAVLAYRRMRKEGPTLSGGLRFHFTSGRAPIRPAEPLDASGQVNMRRRTAIFSALAGTAFGVLLLRLWGMQVISEKTYSEQASSNSTSTVSLRATRGRILDRNGNVLVDNRACMALVAEKDVADDTRVVRRLANLLGMPDMAVRRNIQSATDGAQSLRTVMIDVPQSAVSYVAEHPGQFPGVSIESRTVRTYPYGTLACHLLGYTGTISSEELQAYNADEDSQLTYQSGDIVGKSGVEYQYESVLQGVRGTRGVYVNVSGDVLGVAYEVDPEPGSDIRLTIDANVQAAAESALQLGIEAGEYLHYKPTGAACVCMNCKTGEVLALASYPSYDPSAFIGGISTDAWAQLIAEGANTPLLNRAINGQYPSASTIKPFTSCAALEYGMTNTENYVECTGYWTGLGEQYGMHCWNHSGHGWMNLYEGITNSCDTVFYEIAKSFYYSDFPEGIQEMFRRWGIGSATGIDLPAESDGRVPDSEWKWNHYTWAADSDRAWQGGDTANIAIGQGDILVTPLQMCYAYCGLVNGGVEMWPHVLLDVLSNQTQETVISASQKVSKQVSVSQDILTFVNSALYGVVNETYISDYFQGMPVSVIGKSGTGEAGDDDDNPHAWFCAAAPAEDPTYVVAAIVEHGGGGGYVATNVCRGVLGAIYGVEMTDPISILSSREVSTEQVMD